MNKGTQPCAGGPKGGNKSSKTVDAATALGLGLPQQNAMLSGLAGLGMAHQDPLGSLFGSVGTNPLAGITGLNTGLQSASGGNVLMQLAAPLGGSQQQSVLFQPAQLLQVRQALALSAASYGGRCTAAEIQKRIEAEATKYRQQSDGRCTQGYSKNPWM